MSWIDYEYPNKVFILEVKYSGDITITEARCKEYPLEKDNRYGFTSNFSNYIDAKRYAKIVASELNIKCAL